MSTLKVNQIRAKLRSMFESFLDLSDISAQDAERESKVLTRCLAALAIYLRTGCSEKEAAESVWDGADDNGIEAAYFDVAESQIIFVQSKWIAKGAGEPEAKEVGAFTKGVRDAVEQDASSFRPKLQGKLDDIFSTLAKPGIRVHLILVSTGVSNLARHSTSVINACLNELNGNDPEPIASAETVGLSEVYSGLVNDPLLGTLALDAQILEWSYIATPYPAYFGIIDGLQLKHWWKSFGRRLVASNIRHSLGATEVNNEIRQTATTAPDKFWYFNNGITLVADEASKAPMGAASRAAGNFSFKGASIVNGAQTVSSLGKVDNEESLGRSRVPIRVILLKTAPDGFGNEVTRTNNLQNRIEPRDFVAQDPEQRRLRQEMAIEGVEYQFVRSEESSLTPISCELIEVTTALACASGDSSLAVRAKSGIGSFFTDLTKAPYKSIFNPTLSGARAFNAVRVQRVIEDWIAQKKQTIKKRSGPSWGVLIHGNRTLLAAVFKKFDASKLSQPISTFPTSLQTPAVNALCEGVYAKMVSTIETKYAEKFLAPLFKNQTLSKDVYDLSVG